MKSDHIKNKNNGEYMRRGFNYKQFDHILKKVYGGDLPSMHEWVVKADNQFDTKFEHDQFLNDFINWMRNRKITLED